MKKSVVLLLGVIVISSCNNTSQNGEGQSEQGGQAIENAVGGWSEAAIEGDVQEALDFAVNAINPEAKLKRVMGAKKQVVKGLNYDLSFSLENGESWNAIVYRDLESNLSLTEKTKIPMPGGWADAEINAEMEEAVNFVLSENGNSSPLKEILSAQSQVVKGLNFDLTYELEDGSVWQAIIYRDLEGNFEIKQQPKKMEKRALAGGWNEAEIDQTAIEAAQFMVSQMNTNAKFVKVISVKKQVVNGLNYDLTFELDDNSTWNGVVYQDRDGKFSINKNAVKS